MWGCGGHFQGRAAGVTGTWLFSQLLLVEQWNDGKHCKQFRQQRQHSFWGVSVLTSTWNWSSAVESFQFAALLLAEHFLALGFIGGRLPGHWTTASSQPSWLWSGFSIIEVQSAFIRILIILWFKVITMVNIFVIRAHFHFTLLPQSNYLPSPREVGSNPCNDSSLRLTLASWWFVNLQSLQQNILNVQCFFCR